MAATRDPLAWIDEELKLHFEICLLPALDDTEKAEVARKLFEKISGS